MEGYLSTILLNISVVVRAPLAIEVSQLLSVLTIVPEGPAGQLLAPDLSVLTGPEAEAFILIVKDKIWSHRNYSA